MNYLFIGMLIFINVLQAFTLGLAGKPHQQVILENTIPKEYLNHPEIKQIADKYQLRLWQLAAVYSVLSFSLLFLSYESLQLTAFWILIFASLTSTYLCKIYFIREMRWLLVHNQWQSLIIPKRIDTTLIINKNQRMVPVYWLYLAYIPSLPLAWYTMRVSDIPTASILLASSTSLFLLMLVNYYYIGRIPAKSLTSDSQINQVYNDLTKHSWSFLTILINWLMLPLLFLPIFMSQTSGLLAYSLIVIYSCLLLFMIFFIIAYLYHLRKKQDHLLMQSSDFRYSGEDQYWTYGIYINPNDPKLFVPDRIGMNIGINLGRTSGKIIMAFTSLLLVATFFMTVIPAYLYDFTADPIRFEKTQESILLSAPFAPTSTIPIDTIRAAELIDSLPRPLTKTFGMATDNYAIGRFNTNNRTSYLYIDYRSSPILKIQTDTIDYYYTNKQSKQTLTLYQLLEISKDK